MFFLVYLAIGLVLCLIAMAIEYYLDIWVKPAIWRPLLWAVCWPFLLVLFCIGLWAFKTDKTVRLLTKQKVKEINEGLK